MHFVLISMKTFAVFHFGTEIDIILESDECTGSVKMIEIVDKDNGKQLIDEERHAEKIIKMYKCDSCSYSNKNGGTLSHHKKIHNPDNIPCDVCSKVFISRGYIRAR